MDKKSLYNNILQKFNGMRITSLDIFHNLPSNYFTLSEIRYINQWNPRLKPVGIKRVRPGTRLTIYEVREG